MNICIKHGEALEELRKLPANSVDMCITSPPYWALRDYGTAIWEGGEKKCNHKIPDNQQGRENKHAGSRAARFNRDHCRKCGAKRIDRQLGLEPTFEQYIARLCAVFDEVKRVLRDEGTCWVNLGDSYSAKRWTGKGKIQAINNKNGGHKDINPEKITGMSDKTLVQIPSRFAIEMTNRGWILRNEIIWHKPSCMPSSVRDRFTVDFEKLFFFSKRKKYYFEQQLEKAVSSGSVHVARKGDKSSRIKNSVNRTYLDRNYRTGEYRNKRCVWSVNPAKYKEAHFAVFPAKLIEAPIKAGCPKGGVILDPFMGSGTTGAVAKQYNRNFIGIELNPEYIELARKRISAAE